MSKSTLNSRLPRFLKSVGSLVVSLPLVALSACSFGDSLTPPPLDEVKGAIPWHLNVNYKAINIAVGEEVKLAISPTDAAGNPIDLTTLPPVEYATQDTTVLVDPDGTLRGVTPRANHVVTISMSDGDFGWTRREQIYVTVVDEPFEFSGYRMDLDGPPLVPLNQRRQFPAVVTDESGEPIMDSSGRRPLMPLTYYSVSTPRYEYYLARPFSPAGVALMPSKPTIVASSYIFGKEYSDTVQLNITYPDAARIQIHRASTALNPSPSIIAQTDVTILQGGSVDFIQLNTTSPGDDIIFDEPDKVIGGVIDEVARNPGSKVVFPNVGKFTYKSNTIQGEVRGTITVVEWPES